MTEENIISKVKNLISDDQNIEQEKTKINDKVEDKKLTKEERFNKYNIPHS